MVSESPTGCGSGVEMGEMSGNGRPRLGGIPISCDAAKKRNLYARSHTHGNRQQEGAPQWLLNVVE